MILFTRLQNGVTVGEGKPQHQLVPQKLTQAILPP